MSSSSFTMPQSRGSAKLPKTYVITGGTSSVGVETARSLLQSSLTNRVLIIGLDHRKTELVVAMLSSELKKRTTVLVTILETGEVIEEDRVIGMATDLTNDNGISAMIEGCNEAFGSSGGLTGYINNLNDFRYPDRNDSQTQSFTQSQSQDEYNNADDDESPDKYSRPNVFSYQQFQDQLNGTMQIISGLTPLLQKFDFNNDNGGGAIVLVTSAKYCAPQQQQQQSSSSQYSQTTTNTLPQTLPSNLYKSSIKQLTLSLSKSKELTSYQIRTNAIIPSIIYPSHLLTPQLQSMFPTALDEIKKLSPLGRLAGASEIAQPVLFLVGEGSSFVNGQVLGVDGGGGGG